MSGKWMSVLLIGLVAAAFAKDVMVAELKPARKHFLSEQGFALKKDMTVRIKATGAENRDEPAACAWILSKTSRSVVWTMTENGTGHRRKSFDRNVNRDIRLPEGEYELYFASTPWKSWKSGKSSSDGFWSDIFQGSDSWTKWGKESERWGVSLWVDEAERNALETEPVTDTNHALVKLVPLGDNENEQQQISLDKDMRVRIYAVGEGTDGEMSDYGWIVRDGTDDEVWTMEYNNSHWAGGAEKNRLCDETLMLPAGDYTVCFVTDDSHSYENWNALPPYDPRHWGLTMWPADPTEGKRSVLIPKKIESETDVIVKMTRIGDDRMESDGFTLAKPTRVRITCLGELGHDRHFSDYGWILNTRTREKVWEMTRANTKHAGGAQKNRIFNGVITLEPGSYEVYYITDDSHAYRDWNAGPPRDPESWGITVRLAETGLDRSTILPYREENDPDLLAELIRVGDDEDVEKPFILDEESRVRIYAVGESSGGDAMCDYGWIENGHGRKVWKMRYDDTHHAGGAEKNRMINETMQLPAGEYTVHFRTDGSHAFDDWNDDPPSDPVHWGITVSLIR